MILVTSKFSVLYNHTVDVCVRLLNCTTDEQHAVVLFLVEVFQKLKFKHPHLSPYDMDLTVCDSLL